MELEVCGSEGLHGVAIMPGVLGGVLSLQFHTLICTTEYPISFLGGHSEETWLLREKV